jgi:succinate dehydrogenase/fumarate reductase flavoprotein subunit
VETVDVIVLGTGAAGLVAAVAAAEGGASVGLFEKSDLVGGTTAMSGGVVWMPNNHHMAEVGATDSPEEALKYLESLSLGHLDPAVAKSLVDVGPEAVQWVEDNTPCCFFVVRGYPDYHPEHPGGKPDGGRSLDNMPFSFDLLGGWAAKIRNQRGAVHATLSDTPLGGAIEPLDPAVLAARAANNEQCLGLALVGGLLKGCLDRGVEPQLEHRAVELLSDDGRVIGVRFETPSGQRDVFARRGVVLASGGFEWSQHMAAAFLRGPMTGPASAPSNTGDGLTMAMRVGAQLANMSGAWWVPVARIPDETAWDEPRVRLVLAERTRPRSLMVNGTGRRFCNEAGNYNAMGGAFHAFDPAAFSYPNQTAWLIFDHEHQQRYDVLTVPAGADVPEWIISAPTIAELAAKVDVPADVLEATIVGFNAAAREGIDNEFGRGRSAFDRFNGDQRLPGPLATLGPVDAAPYHAIRIECGTLGTNGGPRTDDQARVLNMAGEPIAGLYAAGNVMASPTGMAYGGAGGTLGPAITFGYIAGRACSGAQVDGTESSTDRSA